MGYNMDDAKDGDVDDKLVSGTISLSDIYSMCNVVVVKTTNFEEPISSNHLDFLKVSPDRCILAAAPELHLSQQQSIPGDHTGRRGDKKERD